MKITVKRSSEYFYLFSSFLPVLFFNYSSAHICTRHGLFFYFLYKGNTLLYIVFILQIILIVLLFTYISISVWYQTLKEWFYLSWKFFPFINTCSIVLLIWSCLNPCRRGHQRPSFQQPETGIPLCALAPLFQTNISNNPLLYTMLSCLYSCRCQIIMNKYRMSNYDGKHEIFHLYFKIMYSGATTRHGKQKWFPFPFNAVRSRVSLKNPNERAPMSVINQKGLVDEVR